MRKIRMFLTAFFLISACNWVFHKLDEIGDNANIGIRGFTM